MRISYCIKSMAQDVKMYEKYLEKKGINSISKNYENNASKDRNVLNTRFVVQFANNLAETNDVHVVCDLS